MKYTIEGFSQEKLVSLKLDVVDALILRWFVDFAPKMTSIEQDGQRYMWVKYQALIDDLPCMGVTSTKSIARRFDKFIECGIMTKIVTEDARHLTCFQLTKKYLLLADSKAQVSDLISLDKNVQAKTHEEVASTNLSNPLDKNVQAPRQNCPDTLNKTLLLDSSTSISVPPNPQGGGNVNVTIPIVNSKPVRQRNLSDEMREVAFQNWLEIIDRKKMEFTEYELMAIKAYAYSKPNLPMHEIESNLYLLDKWLCEGKDVEDSLRQSLSTRSLIKPGLRVAFDSKNNRILSVETLNVVRQNQLAREKAQQGAA